MATMTKGIARKRRLEDQSESTTRKRRKASSTAGLSSQDPVTSAATASSPPQVLIDEFQTESIAGASRAHSKKLKKRQYQQKVEEEDASHEIAVRPTRTSHHVATDKQIRALEKKARRHAVKDKLGGRNEGNNTNTSAPSGWQLSAAAAGRFLDQDPIFVLDERGGECLVAATCSEVQLLSLESSLVVRTCAVPDGCTVTCFAKSTSGSQFVEIACDNGLKATWDWMTSDVTYGTFPAQETAVAMTTSVLPDENRELYYIARSGPTWSIFGERRALYTTQRWLKSIQVLHNGAYIVCLTSNAIILGAREQPMPQSEYVWIELPARVPFCCVEARLVFKNPSKKQQPRRPELALAIGNVEGQIHVYSDLSTIFASRSNTTLPSPRVLHWHREAVSAVKFSRDGNYLISGGKETVLVLWQLETGKQQFLPHLTAEIERIVVSPEGTRYALQMGDNSIMVLSTSELKPVANFAGLQLPILTEHMAAIGVIIPLPAMVLHPRDPHLLLLTVPASQPKTRQDVGTRPFLQTFDTRHSRHVSRQALTRNNVTDFNLGPENTPIIPPDVSQIAVSADGEWLATVDEWYQPGTEFEHTISRASGLDAEDVHSLRMQQEARREVHLKFWRRDENQGLWTLSTRIDAPHNPTTTGDLAARPSRVLKLVADPVTNSFATIGQDSKIKIWKTKTRTRHGMPLKEANGVDAIDWTCKRSTQLPLPAKLLDRAASPMEERDSAHAVSNAALVFSPDGSLLACAQVSSVETAFELVHFVSTSTGAVISSKAGLIHPEHEVVDLAFLHRFFISLTAHSVRTWDLIDNKHVQTRSILGDAQSQDEPMLAVNQTDATFAVLSYDRMHGDGASTPTIQVHDPKEPQALCAAALPSRPAALLAGSGLTGYTIVFEDGTVRNLSSTLPTTPARRGTTSQTMNEATSLSVVEQTEGNVETADRDHPNESFSLPSVEYSTAAGAAAEDDRPVVRPEELASVFDREQSFALPPVREMFRAVVDLFCRKPQRHVDEDRMNVVEVEA